MGLFESPINITKTIQSNKPPQLLDTLATIFEKEKCRLLSEISNDPYELATWWINHQEPSKGTNDRPQPIQIEGKIVDWTTPHIDRVVVALRKFLTLCYEDQKYIISKIETGIPWRGDDIDNYKIMCETQENKNLSPDECFAKLDVLIKRLTRKPGD